MDVSREWSHGVRCRGAFRRKDQQVDRHAKEISVVIPLFVGEPRRRIAELTGETEYEYCD